eukprot:TRINITY_DN70271_c0_g1_i1.p2 TRINITY_DN70271_c0_g1~~TRINITY_DN70271_c0_g1_i1.p2  ORF type:complete len:352 (+),score=115.14 TRINITY_DN70271_c0_g1_i1:135-1190(+)
MAKSMYDTPLTHAVAGAVGGCGALVMTYPLLSLTMRLQMAERSRKQEKKEKKVEVTPVVPAASEKVPPNSPSTTSLGSSVGHSSDSDGDDAAAPAKSEGELAAAMRVFQEMLNEEGWHRLYSGLGSALYGQALIQAAYYYFYATLSAAAARRRGAQPAGFLENIAVSSLAGAAGATVTNPLWVVNAQKVKRGGHESTPHALVRIVKEDGILGLFRGLSAGLVLVANPTVAYTVFERLKAAVLRARPAGATLTAIEIFALSAVGKLVATLVTYPYLLAKTTLQSQGHAVEGDGHYESIGDCLRDVYSRGGVRALYKGVNSKMWQSILTAALLFVLQEKCVRLVISARSAAGM